MYMYLMTIKAHSSKVSYSDERVIAQISPQYSNMILEFYIYDEFTKLTATVYIQVHVDVHLDQCMPIIFFTHRSFSVILSSHIAHRTTELNTLQDTSYQR